MNKSKFFGNFGGRFENFKAISILRDYSVKYFRDTKNGKQTLKMLNNT